MATPKKVTLTMQQRLDVLKDLQTLSISTVALKYKVHHMTIRRIKHRAATIASFSEKKEEEKQRRRLKMPMYAELERRLLLWFKLRRNFGHLVSDALLLKKAAEIKEDIGSCSNFKISKGWLFKFKRRHAIRLRCANGVMTSAEQDVASCSVKKFMPFIKEENVEIEDAHNAKESNFLWKNLPITLIGEGHMCTTDNKFQQGVTCSDSEKRNFEGGQVNKKLKETDECVEWKEGDESRTKVRVERTIEDRDKCTEKNYQTSPERGLKLNKQERDELKRIFQYLESFNSRVPRSTQLLLQAMKLFYLGDAGE